MVGNTTLLKCKAWFRDGVALSVQRVFGHNNNRFLALLTRMTCVGQRGGNICNRVHAFAESGDTRAEEELALTRVEC